MVTLCELVTTSSGFQQEPVTLFSSGRKHAGWFCMYLLDNLRYFLEVTQTIYDFQRCANLEPSLWVRCKFVILCRHLITHLTANSY